MLTTTHRYVDLSFSGDVTYEEMAEYVNNTVISVSGETLPSGQSRNLLVHDGNSWEATSAGTFTAASGLFTEGIQIGENSIHIGSEQIRFVDGSELKTKPSVFGIGNINVVESSHAKFEVSQLPECFQLECLREVEITYSGSFPYKIMDLPPEHEILEIKVEVIEPMLGGYQDETGDKTKGIANVYAHNTHMDGTMPPILNGEVISYIGIYSETASDLHFKIGKQINFITWDIVNVVSGYHMGSGFEWFTLPAPLQVPDSGDYDIGIWSDKELSYAIQSCPADGQCFYEAGDLEGQSIIGNWRGSLYHLGTVCRYGITYSIGDEFDSGYFLEDLYLQLDEKIYTTDSIYGPYDSVKAIYMYRDTASGIDFDGKVRVSIRYRKPSYITTYSGQDGISVFTTDNNVIIDLDIVDGGLFLL